MRTGMANIFLFMYVLVGPAYGLPGAWAAAVGTQASGAAARASSPSRLSTARRAASANGRTIAIRFMDIWLPPPMRSTPGLPHGPGPVWHLWIAKDSLQ